MKQPATPKQRAFALGLGGAAVLALLVGLVTRNQAVQGLGVGLAVAWLFGGAPILLKRPQ